MGLRVLSQEDVHAEAVTALGLDAEVVDLTCTEALAASFRRAAGFACPCTAATLVRTVMLPLRGIVSDLDSLRAREVGFIFQLHNLIPTLTSVENVEIPMMPLGTGRRERRKRASGLLELVGLGHRLHSISTKLSGGERQRVSIARALANSPSLILADEPTGDVDTKTGGQIMQTLLDVRERTGATLIVVTHDPEIAKGAERLIRLKDGKIEEQ